MANLWSMRLFDRFSKRGDDEDLDLPLQASDAELLAWGGALTDIPERPLRKAPLRAAPKQRL